MWLQKYVVESRLRLCWQSGSHVVGLDVELKLSTRFLSWFQTSCSELLVSQDPMDEGIGGWRSDVSQILRLGVESIVLTSKGSVSCKNTKVSLYTDDYCKIGIFDRNPSSLAHHDACGALLSGAPGHRSRMCQTENHWQSPYSPQQSQSSAGFSCLCT
jgi:hypothetical protein